MGTPCLTSTKASLTTLASCTLMLSRKASTKTESGTVTENPSIDRAKHGKAILPGRSPVTMYACEMAKPKFVSTGVSISGWTIGQRRELPSNRHS